MRIARYLGQAEKGRSRLLYEEMFPEDEPEFVDAYYEIKGACNQVLVLEEEEKLIAMLHLNPYRFWLRGSLVDSNYIVAVATRPAYRHQGCMQRLLTKALFDLYQEKQPFAFLMPANEAIYTPFDFRFMKNEDGGELTAATMEELKGAYDLFVWKDARYAKQHIPVKEWETTPMMVRIVHVRELLSHVGTGTKETICLHIRIEDSILPENAGDYLWQLEKNGGSLKEAEEGNFPEEKEPELTVSIGDLGSFLFGAKEAAKAFPQAKPKTLQKLSQIKTLKKIFINEVV